VTEVRRTEIFDRWLRKLGDQRAQDRILIGIDRLVLGLGDVKSLRGSLWEMRISYGPGYRLYFVRRGREIIILLCGGDKGSQDLDIKRAREIAACLEE